MMKTWSKYICYAIHFLQRFEIYHWISLKFFLIFRRIDAAMENGGILLQINIYPMFYLIFAKFLSNAHFKFSISYGALDERFVGVRLLKIHFVHSAIEENDNLWKFLHVILPRKTHGIYKRNAPAILLMHFDCRKK